MKLSKAQSLAAIQVNSRAKNVDPQYIRPLSDFEGILSVSRAAGLAVWQEREAFVGFFARIDPSFNAELFRIASTPSVYPNVAAC